MKEDHILYVVSYKNDKLVKIGKTRLSNRLNRYKKIRDDFKHCNFELSYEFYSNEKEISNLERVLHKLYYKERKSNYFKSGIGKTEWFKGDIKQKLLKEIDHIRGTTFRHLKGPYKINDFSIKNKSNFFNYFYSFLFIGLIVYMFFPK